MVIRKASLNDVDVLVKLRIDYLVADRGGLSEEEETKIRTQLAEYYPGHINKGFIAVLAEIDNKAVSTAFLAISEKPANPAFITGKTGTILNVFTYPEFRRKGYASLVIEKIIEEARMADLSIIELSATPAGKPLYEKFGFAVPESKYTEMKLYLKET